MRRHRALAVLALAALALPVAAWSAEPPPDPTPLWSQYPLEQTASVPPATEITPPPDTAGEAPATTEPPATTEAPADTAQAPPAETAPAQTAPADTTPPAATGPTTTSPALAPAGSVQDAPVANVPPGPSVTHKGRDLTWILVAVAVLLMLVSVAWAIRRNARVAPARRPTPLAPRLRASIERCRVICERTRGHARFAAVVEEPDGTERVVARSPAFRAAAGKEPRPDGRPLAAYEALMDALAEERWRRTGTMRTVHEEDGPEHGTPEWYEEQLERVAAARERVRARRRAGADA
jgi:hypothetical protein